MKITSCHLLTTVCFGFLMGCGGSTGDAPAAGSGLVGTGGSSMAGTGGSAMAGTGGSGMAGANVVTADAGQPVVATDAGASATFPITRISLSAAGSQADNQSTNASVSADGRFVAFASDATNLVEGDTNSATDIFLRDTKAGTTTRVSVDSTGAQSKGGGPILPPPPPGGPPIPPIGDIAGASIYPAISADGRFVAFVSMAENLVPGDTNKAADIFVRDTVAGTTERVSVDSTGAQGDAPSEMGGVSISADGRFVAFASRATNLVAGDTNGVADAFVHDRMTHVTTRVSVDSTGAQGNAATGDISAGWVFISGNGRFVSFYSSATNLVAGDTNGCDDVFQHDTMTHTTTRISVDSAGAEVDGASNAPRVSADGRFVTFVSAATNLVTGDTNTVADVFLRDTMLGTTTRISVGPGGAQTMAESLWPSISGDGRFVTYRSTASNLVTDDTNGINDVFVRDTMLGTTTRISTNSAGAQSAIGPHNRGDVGSRGPLISADGKFVVFFSEAINLVDDDTNNMIDVFLRGPL